MTKIYLHVMHFNDGDKISTFYIGAMAMEEINKYSRPGPLRAPLPDLDMDFPEETKSAYLRAMKRGEPGCH